MTIEKIGKKVDRFLQSTFRSMSILIHNKPQMCVEDSDIFNLMIIFSFYPAAPVFLTELRSQDVPDGCPVSFDCVVIGKPPPTVRWYKDGKLLEENDHYMINEDQEGCHQLIITTVLPTDMGVYRCTAENSSGIASTKAELRVDSEYTLIHVFFLLLLHVHFISLGLVNP